jgi:hypothetical protein
MNPTLLFWAKLGNDTWPDKYHPVICHMIDVAAVTLSLWDTVFRPQLRKWLARRLGLDEDSYARWLAFWSGAPDISKVSPCFQDRTFPFPSPGVRKAPAVHIIAKKQCAASSRANLGGQRPAWHNP